MIRPIHRRFPHARSFQRAICGEVFLSHVFCCLKSEGGTHFVNRQQISFPTVRILGTKCGIYRREHIELLERSLP